MALGAPTLSTRRSRPIDWGFMIIMLVMMTIGMLSLYSASNSAGANQPHHLDQAIWMLIGGTIAFALAAVDYRITARLAYPSVLVVVALLLLVAVIGTTINGSRRWIMLGSASFQPSELLKLSAVLVGARYFSDNEREDGLGLLDIIKPALVLVVPSLLVLMQPDLGTTLTVWLIFGTMCIFERIKGTTLLALFLAGIIAVPLMWTVVMKDYQKDRVVAFMNPDENLQGDAWQVNQSKIAIGSGRVFGKGYLQGTQVQNGFVPYHESDFIFAHAGEQFGFIGSLFVIGMCCLLIVWPLRIARYARDRYGALCAVGISALFFWHVVVNLGMVTGMLPVVGLWLPFASRGGSAIVTVMVCCGILHSISMRRAAF